jgi:hypothetical protein
MSGWTRRGGLLGLAALAGAAARPALARAADEPAIEVGLGEVRSRFFLDVAINGQAGFRFVLDTGSSAHFVSQPLAKRLGLPTVSQSFITGFDGRQRTDVVEMASLRVGGVELGRVRAAAWTDERLEGHDGLIGYPYLAPRAVMALGAQKVSLRSRGEGEGIRVRAEVDGRGAVLVGGLPGAEGRFAFDTGAKDFTISSAYHARLLEHPAYLQAPKLTRRNAAGEERVIGFLPAEISFGDFSILRPPVRIDAEDGRQGVFGGVDGLMGVALIRRYVWAIDTTEGRLRVLG